MRGSLLASPAWCIAVLLPLLGATAHAAGVDLGLDLETVQAKMAAALGPPLTNAVETIQTTDVNGSRTTVIYRRGADRRTVVGSGPFQTQSGIVHGERWLQTENGLTVVNANPAPASTGKNSDTLSTTNNPAYYRITSDNGRGTTVHDDIDPTTFLLRRREVVAPFGIVTTTYEAYQTTGGRTFATAWTIDDRHTVTVQHVVRSFKDLDHVEDKDVAQPPPRRALLEFPSSDPVVVPSRFIGNEVYTRVEINGHLADMVLDTGAGGISLHTDFARSIGLSLENKSINGANAKAAEDYRTSISSINVGRIHLHDIIAHTAGAAFLLFPSFRRAFPDVGSLQGKGTIQGVGGAAPVDVIRLKTIKFGTLEFHDFDGLLSTAPTSYLSSDAGLIGASFLHLFTVDLDYVDGTVFLTPNALARRAGMQSISVPR